MTIKENVGLLKAVLKCPKLVSGLSKLKLLSLSRAYGVSNLYVGIRKDYCVQNYTIDKERKIEGKKTIFYHDEAVDSLYYFDVLGDNTGCDLQKDGVLVISPHVAMEVEKLQDCFDRPKVKRIGGRK